MTRFFAPCIEALFLLALASQTVKASPLCPLGNATLHGTYIVSGGGTVGGAPIAAVGEVTWDGQGNTTAIYTASLNGAIHQGISVTGNYHINPDCTGSHAESDGSHYDFVAAPDGKGTTWISTDSGAVVMGTTVRLKPVESTEAEAQMHFMDKGAVPAALDVTALPAASVRSRSELDRRRSLPSVIVRPDSGEGDSRITKNWEEHKMHMNGIVLRHSLT